MVPGSHKLISEVGAGNPVGPLPPAINLQCPAGTVVMFEGRLLHGTGVNKTDRPRRMYVGNSLKPNFRQQEIWTLSLKPELLPQLTEKMVYRMGLHPTGLGGAEGDWAADLRYWRIALDNGAYLRELLRMSACLHVLYVASAAFVNLYPSAYRFCPEKSQLTIFCCCTVFATSTLVTGPGIRALSPDSTKEELTRNYTWRHSSSGSRLAPARGQQPNAVAAVHAK